MSERAHRLLKDALDLPVKDRADLVAELLASLEGEPDEDVEAAWAAEIERRARAAAADPEGGEDWETVRDQLRDELEGG
jgi:putative addiction module component (TIGR02574 family)